MTRSKVYLQVDRVATEVCAAARAVSVSDLHEAMGAVDCRAGTMSRSMRPVNRGVRIAGPAVTAFCAPADNLMMHRALFLARKGDVLVVQATSTGAQWGDVAAQYAKQKGLEGVVVDGYVRDTDAMEVLRFPVWSTVIGPSSPGKSGHGWVKTASVGKDARSVEQLL